MTPLEGIIEAEGLAAPDELPRHLLGELHTEGFERTEEWWSPGDATVWADAQRQTGVDEAILSEVLECLNDPALVRLFARPPGVAEAWRERSLECVLDGSWITGAD